MKIYSYVEGWRQRAEQERRQTEARRQSAIHEAKRIAAEIWDQLLLNQMNLDMPGLRPPVIAKETHKLLVDFLGFRHKFRNIYGFELEAEKVTDIERKFPEAHTKFKTGLEKFLIFLDGLADITPAKA